MSSRCVNSSNSPQIQRNIALLLHCDNNKALLLVCKWRHGGHVGGQEQKHFSPLGNELYFDANLAEKFLLYWPPIWPPCHVVAKQEYRREFANVPHFKIKYRPNEDRSLKVESLCPSCCFIFLLLLFPSAFDVGVSSKVTCKAVFHRSTPGWSVFGKSFPRVCQSILRD